MVEDEVNFDEWAKWQAECRGGKYMPSDDDLETRRLRRCWQAALDHAADKALAHYMTECRRRGVKPSENVGWDCTAAIRKG
mgnify:CR=1 FL=1